MTAVERRFTFVGGHRPPLQKFPLATRAALRPIERPSPAMSASAYLPFLIQAVLAAGITAVIIGASHFFGQRAKHTRIKDSAYECGVPADGMVHTRFSVKF